MCYTSYNELSFKKRINYHKNKIIDCRSCNVYKKPPKCALLRGIGGVFHFYLQKQQRMLKCKIPNLRLLGTPSLLLHSNDTTNINKKNKWYICK